MESLQQLLRAKPAIAELFSRMNKAGVRWAIFAGSEVALLTGNRAPTDLDIIVHNDDFEDLAELLPQAKRTDDEIITVTTSDGEQLENVASTLVFTLDGTDIDIMARSRFATNEGIFPTYLTDLACQHRLQFETEETVVYLAHPFDTMLIKAFMRRGAEQNKFDQTDAAALVGQLSDNGYVRARLSEVGLSSGAEQFLRGLRVL